MRFWLVFLFVFGTFIGSFLNVLVDRLPKGRNPFRGRSHCDDCGHVLSPMDLIPIISFIFLRRRCRYCRKKLSYQYPIIELATAFMYNALYLFIKSTIPAAGLIGQPFPYNVHFLAVFVSLLIIFSAFLVIFVADLKYQIIPDSMVVTVVLGTLFYSLLSPHFSVPLMAEKLLSATGACGFFWLIYVFTKGRGLGFGDVKLAFALGFFLGFPEVFIGIYLAFLTGAAVSIILILSKKKRMKSKIAFGPFLIAGTIESYFFGQTLIQWYTRIFF